MSEIMLGGEIPHLLVILQSDFGNKFAITVQVESSELIGVDAKLKFGDIIHVAVLSSTTYTWTLTSDDVSELTTGGSALLYLESVDGQTPLGRGIVEVR